MRGIIMQIMQAAKKDSLFLGTTVTVAIVTILSFFLGSNALVEENQAKIVYTASMSRITTIVGFIIFIVFYIKRLFENREIEVLLSRPISRTSILFSMIFSFSLLFIILSLPVFAILILVLKVSLINALIWIITIILEGILVLSFTLFFALLINSSVHSLVLAVITYIMCRIIGSFVAYLSLNFKGGIYQVSEAILKILSIFIPRLDLMGKSSWLLYGDYTLQDLYLILAQVIVFTALMFFASVFDFKRKQF